MAMNDFFDERQIRKAIAILKPDGQLFEARVIDGSGKVYSGYFTSADRLIDSLRSEVSLRGCQVYYTLNAINAACYSRTQRDRLKLQGKKDVTTDDKDIDGYQWMLIDLDPERATGVSSTDAELAKAEELFNKVYEYLRNLGFEEPVKAISGNGYHLLYHLRLANVEENKELVKRCLTALDEMFSNDDVHIDTVNYNPSRICKLYGTLAQKGANTEDRPHRMSRIISDRAPAITDKAFLEKLAGQVKAPERKQSSYRDAAPGQRFSVERFMSAHGISYNDNVKLGRDGSAIYSLEECPFNSNHRNGDAKIFAYPSGEIAFKCHHNSCRDKAWRDVRLLYEPDAYAERTSLDAEIEAGWQQHNRARQNEIPPAAADQSEMFRTASQIAEDDEPDHEFIRSGISLVDENMHGFEKQCISVVSGLRGSGKTTLIGSLILTAVQDGHTVVCYSGELANKKYLHWLDRQAAGKAFVEVSTQYKNAVGVSAENQKRIHDWMGDKLWLYNNRHGNQFSKISVALEQILAEKKADLCIIDNMMALDLAPDRGKDKYDAQTDFVWALKNIAQRTNTHIVFVAHPKKAAGFIRLDDISGAGNIGNIVDNAFMVHRNNQDFQNRLSEFSKDLYLKLDRNASNFIEIAKDREGGLQDFFIPLYYEENSKRLRNSLTENIVYGWVPEFPIGSTIVDEKLPFED